MKRISVAFVFAIGMMAASACGSKKPEQTAQNQTPAANPATPSSQPAAGQPGASQPGAQPGAGQPAPEAQAQQTADAAAAGQTPSGEMMPEAAAPNDLPAVVTLTDGSKYRGVLVSKNGSQLTFRGENGATRAFDSRDIKSIRFGEEQAAAPARTPKPQPTPKPAQPASETATAPAAAPAPTAAPAPPPPPRQIVLPAGTQISVRTNEPIDAKKSDVGQTYSASISRSVVDDEGKVAIPRGAPATLVIRQASSGKMKSNELVLDVQSVTVNGRTYEVETADLVEKGKSGVGANKRTGAFVGGGAALGAIIGAIAGGGKGAAIGGLSGAGAGAAGQIFTRGSVKVPAETVLTFQLQSPLRLASR